jgi:hypothetical protein
MTKRLIVFTETIAVYCENRTTHTNSVYEQNNILH